MKLIINGKQQEFENINTIQDLVEYKTLMPNTFAIAINNIFISKTNYSKAQLKDSDKVEILEAMVGG